MEERAGEGRSVSPGVFMSGWSVWASVARVPSGPQDTNTQIAELCPALRYLHLAYFALLSPGFPAAMAGHASQHINNILILSQTN